MNKPRCQDMFEGSDIGYHLPLLAHLAAQCDVVVEFGVRCGESTRAMAPVTKQMVSYDIVRCKVDLPPDTPWELKVQSSLEADIPECDLLFIDSEHTYDVLSKELERHHEKVRCAIAMHDTWIFGERGGDGKYPGMEQAILEFQLAHPEWETWYSTQENHGLTILKRSNCDGLVLPDVSAS